LRSRLIGLAGPARGAAGLPGLGERHPVQVVLAHEADEDALRVVIPRDAGDDGDLAKRVDFRFRVRFRGRGLGVAGGD